MRVLYDGLVYSIQAVGGINRYFAQIVERLPEEVTPILLAESQRKLAFPQHPRLEVTLSGAPAWPKPLRRVARWLGARRIREAYGRIAADVVHPTYYGLLGRMDIQQERRPLVVTVYDMIHERFAAILDPHGRHAAEKRRAVLAATAVICISENTKRDLLECIPFPEHQVWVTPLASDMHRVVPAAPDQSPPQPFFLHVGSRASYKNFDRLLAALVPVVARSKDVRLCVVGPPFSRAEQRRIADLHLERHVLHGGYVTDAVLARLYRDAVALVYPSLYEGFGIPPLEAMSCGGVVVAARTSSLPEVVGDGGLLFDPHSTDELAARLIDLLELPTAREEWRRRGRERARLFDWDHTTAQTVAVYHAAAAGTRHRLSA
jgi:glycosyltransferase involved in cell wall biosynthesis